MKDIDPMSSSYFTKLLYFGSKLKKKCNKIIFSPKWNFIGKKIYSKIERDNRSFNLIDLNEIFPMKASEIEIYHSVRSYDRINYQKFTKFQQ